MTAEPTVPPGLAVQGGTVPLLVEAGLLAERSGLPSIWTSEFYDRSATVTLAALAAVTSRIELGSSIAWAFGRTPLTLATDFRSLDELSGGRLSMGLGTGNAQVISDWHGLTEPRPLARLTETVELVRQLWRLHEQPVAHDGEFYRCHLPADPSLPPLSRGTLPILLAGGRPAVLRAAGAVADGLVGQPLATAGFTREVVHSALLEGAEKAGRSVRIPIAGMILCSISEDSAKARAAAALQVAVYVTRKSADAILQFHGFEAEGAAIREAFARQDFPAMAAAVSARMLDETAVFGTPEEARDRYRDKFAALYERPLLFLSRKGLPAEQFQDDVTAVCETFAQPRGR